MSSTTSIFAIILSAVLTNNFIFSQFLGCCPFLGCSSKIDTAAGMGLGISSVTEMNTMWLMLIMTVCGAIGLVGLGRIHDLKFEQWFAIWKADRDWPKVALFAAPTLSPHGDRASAKAKAGKRPKKETSAEKAAAMEADAEAEA